MRTRNANERRSPNPSGRALLSRNEGSRERVGRGARLVPAIQGWIYLFARVGGRGIDSVHLPPQRQEGPDEGSGPSSDRVASPPGPGSPVAVKPARRAAPLRSPSGDCSAAPAARSSMTFAESLAGAGRGYQQSVMKLRLPPRRQRRSHPKGRSRAEQRALRALDGGGPRGHPPRGRLKAAVAVSLRAAAPRLPNIHGRAARRIRRPGSRP